MVGYEITEDHITTVHCGVDYYGVFHIIDTRVYDTRKRTRQTLLKRSVINQWNVLRTFIRRAYSKRPRTK